MQRLATFLSPHLKQRRVRFGKRQLPVPPVAEVCKARSVLFGMERVAKVLPSNSYIRHMGPITSSCEKVSSYQLSTHACCDNSIVVKESEFEMCDPTHPAIIPFRNKSRKRKQSQDADAWVWRWV